MRAVPSLRIGGGHRRPASGRRPRVFRSRLLNNPFASAPVRDPATGMPCPALRNVTILVANYYSIPLVEGLPPQIPALLKAFNDALAFAISSVPVPAGSRLALVDLYTPSLDRHGLVLIERRGGVDGPLDFDPHLTNAGYTFIAKQFEDALTSFNYPASRSKRRRAVRRV
jgi:hypothetical protein